MWVEKREYILSLIVGTIFGTAFFQVSNWYGDSEYIRRTISYFATKFHIKWINLYILVLIALSIILLVLQLIILVEISKNSKRKILVPMVSFVINYWTFYFFIARHPLILIYIPSALFLGGLSSYPQSFVVSYPSFYLISYLYYFKKHEVRLSGLLALIMTIFPVSLAGLIYLGWN